MNIHYLEIVTPEVEATCAALEKTHGPKFGEPIAEFGNAPHAKLNNGGRLGVRAPMRETEEPNVRPYILVEDINAAAEAAQAAGGEFAMLPTEIPSQGSLLSIFWAASNTVSGSSDVADSEMRSKKFPIRAND